MKVVGLTGSIGMGKSTTAELFADEGAPVWSADDAVHRLYARGGAAVAPMRVAFPAAVKDDAVDREALSALLQQDPSAFVRLEAIVHPLVAHDRTLFLARAADEGQAVAVVDVPLLFETGGDALVDAVVVASAPAEVQRERVLTRPGMTAEKLGAILARQLPDMEKRARADFVVDTSRGIEPARAQVRAILAMLASPDFKSRTERLDAPVEPLH